MSTSHNAKLLEAARRCDGHALGNLVTSGKVNIDVTDQAGCTAVHLCAKSADLTSLATLLEHGARIDCFDHSGLTALHHAAGKDYVETMALLVAHGADINVPSQKSRLTPLQYSTMNRRHKASEFLLFCGADYDIKELEKKLSPIEFNNTIQDTYEEVRAGFKNRRIILEGKTIRTHGRTNFKSLGLAIETHDNNPNDFIFFCRRSLLELSDCSIETDKSDAISDVFDYLLNATLEHVDVTIHVYTEASKFDMVYVKDNKLNEYHCKHMKTDATGIFYTTRMTLHPYEEDMNSFAVYMRTKTDTFITTGLTQTCQSTVEDKFQIEIPPQCVPANVSVTMQVFPVSDFITSRYTDDIRSASNLCSAYLGHRHRKPVSIQLPVPTGLSTDDDVRIYHAATLRDGVEDCSFEEVDSDVDSRSGYATVKDHSIANGISIVTNVRRTKTNVDIKTRIKRFLSWLYTVVANRQKHVVFYGLTKVTSETYHVLVGLSTEGNAESDIRKWKEDNYVTKSSQTSRPILSKPKQIFTVICSGINATVIGRHALKLSMQVNRLSYQEFLVSSRGNGIGQIGVYMYNRDNCLVQKCNECDCVTQINVELRNDASPTTFQTFTEFPDSHAVAWIAREIGNEWFLLGISLGFRCSFLERIDRGTSAHRRVLTMLYAWRGDNNNRPDIGLTALYQGLKVTGRGDLISNINRRLHNLMVDKPGERAAKWARSLLCGLDDVDAPSDGSSPDFHKLVGEKRAVSPFTEQFLLTALQVVGARWEIAQQLGVPTITSHSTRDSWPEHPDTAMFKCLVYAQRQHGERGEKLIRDLLAALSLERDQDAVERIVAECNMWLSTKAKNEDEKTKRKRLHAVLNKFS